MDLYERLRSGYYDDVGPMPAKPSKKDLAVFASGKHEKALKEYKDKFNQYKVRKAMLHEQFVNDLAVYHGLDASHAKTRKAFDIAWEHGHAYGYHEVASYFAELVPLLED